MVVHICIVCLKQFKLKTDLERHKNRKNKCISKNIDNNTSITESNTQIPHETTQPIIFNTQITHNTHNNNTSINQSKILCNNCNKFFSRYDSLKRHQLFYCIPNDDNKETIKNDNNDIQILKNEIFELKNIILEMKDQKTSQNITNTNTNSNNTINNTNNNNITFNIIKFGDENPAKKLTTKEIEYIINAHRNTMLQRSIEITHFNNKHPEYQNVYISDKKMQNAHIYNGDKFDLKSIDFVIDDLILNHINNLDDYKNREDIIISDNKHEEIDTIVDNFQNYRDSGSDKEKRIYKKAESEIKEMLYNNKDKVIETKKRLGRKKLKNIKYYNQS